MMVWTTPYSCSRLKSAQGVALGGCGSGGTRLPPNRGFVQGAVLLAGAAILTKLLGSVYTIVLQNIIGDHGMGLFQMAYPIYATLLAVATAGFPVAISKLVSERLAHGDVLGARAVFRTSSGLLTIGGVACFFILFFGADTWARVAGDLAAAPAIRAIAPALLLVPVMSALRGYFQGYQWMEPTASSQVLEQIVRVATILGLALWIERQGYGESIAAAGAAFGAVTGAGASLALLIRDYRVRHPMVTNARTVQLMSGVRLGRRLIYLAFPISLGALVVPLMNNVDVVTVVNLLKQAGMAQSDATTAFGLLTGRAFKLMMLPTTLATGIGVALMPAVSEAFTLGYRAQVSDRIDTAVRLTIMIALPAAVGLAVLAEPVNIALFRDAAGLNVIRIMAVATLFASVQATAAAVLQGGGWVYLPVFNLIVAGGVKLLLNLVLVPPYGIEGAAAATVLSYFTAAILNLAGMQKRFGEPIRWLSWVIKPAAATFVMGGCAFALERQWLRMDGIIHSRVSDGLFAIVACILGMLIYAVALLASGAMSKDELGSVPKFGPILVSWCSKLGVLR